MSEKIITSDDWSLRGRRRSLITGRGPGNPVDTYEVPTIATLRKKIIEDIDLSFLFKDRHDLGEEFNKWAEEHKAEVCPMNVIAWFTTKFNKHNKQIINKRFGVEE